MRDQNADPATPPTITIFASDLLSSTTWLTPNMRFRPVKTFSLRSDGFSACGVKCTPTWAMLAMIPAAAAAITTGATAEANAFIEDIVSALSPLPLTTTSGVAARANPLRTISSIAFRSLELSIASAASVAISTAVELTSIDFATRPSLRCLCRRFGVAFSVRSAPGDAT